MHFFYEYLTRRVVLILSLITTLFFLAFFAPFLSGLCTEFGPRFWPGCGDYYVQYVEIMFWAPVFLLFSVATFFFNEKVFRAWITYTVPWIIFSTIIVAFIPDSLNYDVYTPLRREIAVWLAAIFFLVSILIIFIWSVFKPK